MSIAIGIVSGMKVGAPNKLSRPAPYRGCAIIPRRKIIIRSLQTGAPASTNSTSEPNQAAGGAAAGNGGEPAGGLTEAQVEGMDKAALHKLLMSRGLPTSGKLDRLRERVKKHFLAN